MTTLVLTIIGPDRPGLIKTISETITRAGGNWLDSKMANLAGQFAGIVQISVPPDVAETVSHELEKLQHIGLHIHVATSLEPVTAVPRRRISLDLVGQDHVGIVHDISETLAHHSVNVEELETTTFSASMSGENMFRATATLMLPESVQIDVLDEALQRLSQSLMVDITLAEL